MMVTVLKGKNKIIASGLVGVSSALIFLTAVHIAAKIAVIVTAAAVTYALLSLINKARAKSAKTHDMSEDEGYSSIGEDEEKDIVEEPEKTEAKLEREQKRMRKGSLGGPMNAFGEPILVKAIGAESSNHIDYTKAMVMPDKIVLDEPDNRTFVQNNSSSIKSQMKSLPEHMDVFGDQLPEQVSSNLELESKSTKKLSPKDWLLRHGSINNDERKVLKQPITQKGFNGLGFNRQLLY